MNNKNIFKKMKEHVNRKKTCKLDWEGIKTKLDWEGIKTKNQKTRLGWYLSNKLILTTSI